MWKLGFLVFVCSSVVMMFEIVGSRIMAPYFGSTIYTWVSLISVVLLALSLGYYVGGLVADRKGGVRRLVWIVSLASVSLLIISVFRNVLFSMVLRLGGDIRIQAMVGALLIAGLPSLFLAMIYPYAVRLQLKSIVRSGRVVGTFYALSSLGSVMGTLVAAYALLPYMTVDVILAVFVLLLMAASLIVDRQYLLFARVFLVLVSLLVIRIYVLAPKVAKYMGTVKEQSLYSEYVVFDEGEGFTKRYVTNSAWGKQSGIVLEGEEILPFEYLKFYRLGSMWVKEHERVLMLGGGVYAYPRDHVRRNPEVVIDVVEIDPKLTELATKHFGFEDERQIKRYHNDGRVFVRQAPEDSYDLVFIDVFASGPTPPEHMTTLEFIKEVDRVLKPGGVVIMNTVASIEGVGSEFFWSEYKTIRSVFDEVEYYYLSFGSVMTNIMLVGSQENLDNPELAGVDTPFVRGELIRDDAGIVLRDDLAPVEYYYMKYYPSLSPGLMVERFGEPSFWRLIGFLVEGK